MLGVALGLALVRCSPGGFSCSDDVQCSLSGTPGVCLADGRCAYPDPDCTSGLALPAGAPGADAGQCVPGDPPATDGMDGSSSGGVGVTSTEADGTTTAPAESGHASSDSGIACSDTHEPNESIDSAAMIPFGIECFVEWEGQLADPSDIDWFVVDNVTQVCSGNVTVVAAEGIDVCVAPQCPLGMAPEVFECDGEIRALEDGAEACCAWGNVLMFAECLGSMPSWGVRLTATPELPDCTPYNVLATEA